VFWGGCEEGFDGGRLVPVSAGEAGFAENFLRLDGLAGADWDELASVKALFAAGLALARAPLLLAILLSHTSLFPRVH
jgi:hypothetical protein